MRRLSRALAICSVVGGDPGRETGRERVDSVGLTSLPPPLPLLLPASGISSRMNCNWVELQLRSAPFQSVELGRLLATFEPRTADAIIFSNGSTKKETGNDPIKLPYLQKLGCRLWTFSCQWSLVSARENRG